MIRIEPYRKHAIFCVGVSCGENMPLLKYLKEKVAEAGVEVRVNRAGCLGVCTGGPIMVVYPEGVWYAGLTKERIDRIVEEHFKRGKPVREWVVHDAGFSSSSSA
ncbi:MAG: ferredoxin [Zetaproteobacteria bacterium]|nr:MAG: ferredoxin [Zetaproteobacteria bacterium]